MEFHAHASSTLVQYLLRPKSVILIMWTIVVILITHCDA